MRGCKLGPISVLSYVMLAYSYVNFAHLYVSAYHASFELPARN